MLDKTGADLLLQTDCLNCFQLSSMTRSVKKFSFILKTAIIFRQNLPTPMEEYDVSLFWLPLCDMPSPLDLPCACGTFKKPMSSVGSVGSLVLLNVVIFFIK